MEQLKKKLLLVLVKWSYRVNENGKLVNGIHWILLWVEPRNCSECVVVVAALHVMGKGGVREGQIGDFRTIGAIVELRVA